MDNRKLILSVAGSGKTTYIINSLKLEKRALIITYTENNYSNLRQKVIEKFGYLPDEIEVMTYFGFLYSFCYRPFLYNKIKDNGYNFLHPPGYTLRKKRTDPAFYLDSSKRLYYNRVAKLLEVMDIYEKIKNRIEKYFDEFYVDEVQDFGGHDFNLLLELSQIDTMVMYVGDFYQHTFDTSRDGNTNKSLHKDYRDYIKKFENINFRIDKVLNKSYRCSRTICEFVNDKLGIEIESHNDLNTEVILIEDKVAIDKIIKDTKIVKLFYQNSKKYDCYSLNWGESKGQDHHIDVCVVLNKSTAKLYKKDKLEEMNVQTRNKFYVACTRARNRLIFIPEKLVKEYKIT